MKIQSVRLGHATNSSSAHSIILLADDQVGSVSDKVIASSGEFGWEEFTLASRSAKLQYLAQSVLQCLKNEFPNSAHQIANELFGFRVPDGYIDHQSYFGIPVRKGNKPDLTLVKEYMKLFSQDNVVVLGGNDNDGWHPLSDYGVARRETDEIGISGRYQKKDRLHFRKDPSGHWTIFNTGSGAKLRVSFDPHDFITSAPAPSIWPELVDLKVSDYCPIDCHFCLDPATPVLLDDHSWKTIGSIQEGDRLIAFDEYPQDGQKQRKMRTATVERIWSTRKPAMRVTTTHGEVICSYDHRFLLAHNGGRWMKAGKLRLGHTIMHGGNWTSPDLSDRNYMLGYIQGLADGDGTVRWEPIDDSSSGRQVWWRVALKDDEPLERLSAFLDALEIDANIRPFRDADEKGAAMSKIEIRSRDALLTLRTTLESADATSNDYKKGYLAGFCDAEGSCSVVLRLHQLIDNGLLDRVEGYLRDFNFEFVREGNGTRIRGGTWEILRFFGMMNPAIQRKRPEVIGQSINHSHAEVVKLEALGEQELIDVQTSTKTFYARGFAAHNCYQDSTTEGQHADFGHISRLIKALGKDGLKIFELAIGGGEPTMYPRILDLLDLCVEEEIVPNLTTKSLHWLKDNEMRERILSTCGGIGHSVMTEGDVSKAIHAFEDTEKLTLHIIPAIAEDLEAMLELAKKKQVAVLLLGYKTTGRGKEVIPRKEREWMDIVLRVYRGHWWSPLGIDTPLAKRYENLLKDVGIPSRFYETEEGVHSMYIDAVEGRMAAASYGPETSYLPMDLSADSDGLTEQVLKGFSKARDVFRTQTAVNKI